MLCEMEMKKMIFARKKWQRQKKCEKNKFYVFEIFVPVAKTVIRIHLSNTSNISRTEKCQTIFLLHTIFFCVQTKQKWRSNKSNILFHL